MRREHKVEKWGVGALAHTDLDPEHRFLEASYGEAAESRALDVSDPREGGREGGRERGRRKGGTSTSALVSVKINLGPSSSASRPAADTAAAVVCQEQQQPRALPSYEVETCDIQAAGVERYFERVRCQSQRARDFMSRHRKRPRGRQSTTAASTRSHTHTYTHTCMGRHGAGGRHGRRCCCLHPF